MPGLRNPFESYLSPRKSYTNPTEENVGRLGRLRFDPWSAQNVEQDRETEPAVPKRDWSGYLKDLKEIYSNEGPAQSAYQQHLQQLPQQESPSVWGRIVAGIVGAGTGFAEGPSRGIAAAQGIVKRPYERALEEWQNKEAGLSRSAEIEEKNLGRRLGYMKEVREVEEAKASEEAKAEERELKRQAQADLARYRDAQITELENRGWVTLPPNAAGETIMANPRTNEQKNFGKALAGAQFEETKRHQGVTEKQAGERLQQGWKGLQFEGQRVQQGAEGLGLERRRTETGEDAERRRAEAAASGGTARYIPPTQQTKATEMGISEAIRNRPHWAKWTDAATGTIKPPTPKRNTGKISDVDWNDYQEFLSAVEASKKRIFGTTYGGLSGGQAPEDEDEYGVRR